MHCLQKLYFVLVDIRLLLGFHQYLNVLAVFSTGISSAHAQIKSFVVCAEVIIMKLTDLLLAINLFIVSVVIPRIIMHALLNVLNVKWLLIYGNLLEIIIALSQLCGITI